MSYQPLWLRDLAAYSIQAAMLVGVGAVMASLLRLRVPQVRLAYWQALLAVCVFLPLLQPWRPEVLVSSEAVLSAVASTAPAASAPTGPSLAEILLGLICAGIFVRLAWMALGCGRLWLYRRRAERMGQAPTAIMEAQRLAPVSPAFFISRQIPTPATFGFFRPAVLFPARFLEMEPAMQKAIALHELLHVERRDWLWNMFEELVLTLLWFHLPLWWVVRSTRLSREQVVDAEAVRRSHERRPYLKALLEMAGQKWLAESLPAPLFLRESQLAERVALMMKEVHMSRTRLTVSILTAAVTLLMAGATLVWAFPLKTSAPQAESPATSPAPTGKDSGTYQYQGKDYKFTGPVYKVGGDVEAPVPVYKPEPPYTPEAKKAHLSGPVVLWAIIDTKGEVAETKEQSKPLGRGLDENALKTVRTWKFKPAMRHGAPVPVKVMVEVYFRYFNGDKPDAGSQKADPASDPPAQSNQSASKTTDNNHNLQISQNDIQRQIDDAVKHAQMAQQVPVKIDQAKIQEQIDQAMKQLKLAEAVTPKIDEAKIKQQIEQAMKQVQMSQDVAPKIDQEKLHEQINQAMKQMEKMNTPEMRQKMQEQMKQLKKMDTSAMRQKMQVQMQAMEQLKKLNTPEMRQHMQEQMEQLKKMDTSAMRQKMQVQMQAMEQLKKLNTPEMRQHMQGQMEQLKKMNTPEMRQQLKQAMEQAMMAQESAQKMNKDEMQRQLEQARKEVEQARKEAQDARAEAQKARQSAMKDAQAAREEAQKARQDAMKARREAEEQRKAAKPRPSEEPKPVPVPPKEAAPAPPAPPAPPASAAPPAPPASPAPPKTPESAGIVRGVPGGVVGGVPGGIVGGVPGGVVGGVPGGKVTGVQGGIVKGVDGGLAIGVPGGITGGVITAPKPPAPPSTSPKEAVPPPAASPVPTSPPQN